jgi:hypothetical protein
MQGLGGDQMNLATLIQNVREKREEYAQMFAAVSQQKSDDLSQNLRRLRDLEMIGGAIYALDQVLALVEGDTERRKNAAAQDTEKMTLTKEDVNYLRSLPCFSCRWSGIDPYDWGLRCCCDKSELCTDYCPEDRACPHYEREAK